MSVLVVTFLGLSAVCRLACGADWLACAAARFVSAKPPSHTTVAAAATRILRKALYGVNNLDPLSYAAGVGVLIAILVVAALVPARRALHLDLAKALHYD